MGNETPSFGWLVIARAWRGTLHTFEATWRAILLAVVLAAVSLGFQLYKNDWDTMIAEWGQTFWFTIMPILVVGGAILLWNLWLAPSALAYEKANLALKSARIDPKTLAEITKLPAPKFNYNPLRLRDIWTASEFATVLAAVSNEGHSASYDYARTVVEAMALGKLPYHKVEVDLRPGVFYRPDSDSKLKKSDAITWAEANGFDMTPIK